MTETTTTDGRVRVEAEGAALSPWIDLTTLQGDVLRCFRRDRWVTTQLLRTGEFSPGEADLFRLIGEALGPHANAIEVGANIGAHTATLSRCFRRVFAFEPVPAILELLLHNTRVNSWGCVAYNYALSDTIGKAHYMFNPANPGGSTVGPMGVGESLVEVQTLDRILMTPPDFIKIDVEGHEPKVLRGALDTIRKHQPVLYFEVDRITNEDGSAGPAVEALDLVESLDYDLWFHSPLLARDPADCTDGGVTYASHNALAIPRDTVRYGRLREALADVPNLYPMVRETRPEVKVWRVDNG